MIHCQWGYGDCRFLEEKCSTCFSEGFHYQPRKEKKKSSLARRQAKPDKRKGSEFEYSNHRKNVTMLKNTVSSSMTANSGATAMEKGDEQIRGIINIMEEYKTQEAERARGTKQFTIKREWLDKLHYEAKAEQMEFWVLKFAFSEDEAAHQGGLVFVVLEDEQFRSMILTMTNDRKRALLAQSKIDVAERRKDLVEAENTKLQAEIRFLKAKLKQLEAEKETK